MPKLLIKGAHISTAANAYTRHVTPRPVCHLSLAADAHDAFTHIDPGAAGLFVPMHPTLGVLPPPLYRRPDGGPLHCIAGVTIDPFPAPDAAGFLALDQVEIWVTGHLRAYRNDHDSTGAPICGMQWTGSSAFADSISDAAKIWETGEDWASVAAKYKHRGNARADPGHVRRDIPVVRWA